MASAAEVREARKVMAKVEKQLARLAEREERLHADMVEHAMDHGRVGDLHAKLQELHGEREELELEWLEAADLVG
jgi:DNA repair exonuclease SbcCD ATPase subunit